MRLSILFALVMLFLAGCAKVQEITGGEKDTTPPQLLSAAPPNGTTNFTGKRIRLEFDERIQLERVRERFLVSPPLEETPEVRIVGARSVEIALKSELLPNTTYSFYLGECVKDLNEGNPAAGLHYVLSTGDALDSLSLDGQVVDAFSAVAVKQILVLLYPAGDSAAFRSGRPSYLTRSNDDGSFRLKNLPPGRFSVFALADKNGNFRYDLPNEEIAFLDTTIILSLSDTTPPSVSLRSFLPSSPQLLIRSYSVTPDRALQLVMSRAADTLYVRDIARTGGSLTWLPEYNSTRDTVLLWPSDTTALREGSYELRSATAILDTVRYRPSGPMPFNTKVASSLQERGGEHAIRLRASRPVASMDSTRVMLIQDSIPLTITRKRAQGDHRTLYLETPLEPGGSAVLVFLPKAILDIYGGTNDSLRIPLGRAAEDATGTLRVALSGLDSTRSYLLQLLDQQGRVVRESRIIGSVPSTTWTRLPPGTCTPRLIQDENGNGRWDTGTWSSLTQPERTWQHPEPVTVRAAWDVVLDWKLK